MIKAIIATLLLSATVQAPASVAASSDAQEQMLRLQLARQSLQMYYIHLRHFPTTSEGLAALWRNPGSAQWRGPYALTSKTELDLWGTPVRYQSDGASCTLTAAGPDQEFDTKDDISLVIDKPLEQNPPKDDQQVYFDVRFADPGSTDPLIFGSDPPQKYLMNGIVLSIYHDPMIERNVAKLALTSRTYSSMGFLVAQKETAALATEGRQFEIQSTILMNDRLWIKLSQNFVTFACSSGGYCRSDADLNLKNGETVAIAVEAKHAPDPKYTVMILTPHIIRSPADFEQVMQRKQELSEHFKE